MKIDPIYTSKPNSILLKEKGFDVECKAHYLVIDELNEVQHTTTPFTNPQLSQFICVAPEHWVVIEWFKQVHGIWVSIDRDEYGKYFYEADHHSITYGEDGTFDTSYEATEAAIEYVLTNLI